MPNPVLAGDAELDNAGKSIDAMRTMRSHADCYMPNATVETPSVARDMAESARGVIEHGDEFAAGVARKGPVADAIAKHRIRTRT